MASRIISLLALCGALASPVLAQFGPPEPQGSGPKLHVPASFPPSGTFPTTESVTLLDDDPNAAIHYTLDGSTPNSHSPVYNPLELLFVSGVYDGNHGLKTGYTIRAVAMSPGHTNSDVSTFQFVIDRRDRTSYVSEEILPGVRMIRDSDNDKMFLIRGTKEYVLIDSGMGRGDLRDCIAQYTEGLPLEVVFTHNHPDHIGQADQFIKDSIEHIGTADRARLESFLKERGVPADLIAAHVVDVHDGDEIDLGDRHLILCAAPGHTTGSIVIYDPVNQYLFTGDAFGSNSPTIPDALWMQFDQSSLDNYLSMIENCRLHFRGKVRYMMTGHNDRPLVGEQYLDNLQLAVQELMDKGDAVLVPSYRPVGLKQVIVGDRFNDPDWVAVNVNLAKYLPALVDQIDGLTLLEIENVKTLTPAFSPEVLHYTAVVPEGTRQLRVTVEPTSSRARNIRINGVSAMAGEGVTVKIPARNASLEISVTSPDGAHTAQYTVDLK